MINLGTSTMQDFALGDNLVERIDLGDTTIFDPYTTITGTLPLTFNSRAAVALKNYRIYGTANGAGVATESGEPAGFKIPILNTSGVTKNLFDEDGITENYYINENGEIKAYNGFGYSDPMPVSSGNYAISNLTKGSADGWTCRIHGYDANGNWVRQIKTVAVVEASMSSSFMVDSGITDIRISIKIVGGQDLDVLMITPGDTPPDHYIPHRHESNYDLFIGDTKLGEEEYLDYAEQKIYKDVSGTLTPTDPPAPLPAIQAYQGENTLSSTETVGEVSVKGRISEISP